MKATTGGSPLMDKGYAYHQGYASAPGAQIRFSFTRTMCRTPIVRGVGTPAPRVPHVPSGTYRGTPGSLGGTDWLPPRVKELGSTALFGRPSKRACADQPSGGLAGDRLLRSLLPVAGTSAEANGQPRTHVTSDVTRPCDERIEGHGLAAVFSRYGVQRRLPSNPIPSVCPGAVVMQFGPGPRPRLWVRRCRTKLRSAKKARQVGPEICCGR